jgi:protoporphyrinogen oxidase
MIENEYVDVAVLGAGVAGLGASLRARELGLQAVLFEARDSAGGLLDNFEIDGFRFDHAVHLSFATEEKVRSIFDRTPYITHPSDSYCFEDKHWLKHPVQNNLFPLPAEEKAELIESFLARPADLAGEDYESWLRHQYGDRIAERFPIRYTEKYWGTNAASLSTSWIGNRMRRAELREILFGALSDETPNTYYTKEMRYPKFGGYKSFIGPLIDEADIRLNHRVVRVDLDACSISFANGMTKRFGKLVSTLPLPVIVGLFDAVPERVRNSSEKLVATSIDLVSVGFNRKVTDDLWFYIYDNDIFASRAYSPSVKSPDNAPPGCSSLQFEAYSRGPDSRYRPDELKQNVLYALEKMCIATADDVCFMDHRRLPYGNVIFERGMEAHRKTVLDWLGANGISSCGRFGSWDYLWSNQSLLSGYQCL